MNEEDGDGEVEDPESLSLLAYTPKYISLTDVDRYTMTGWVVITDAPALHLCTRVREEGGDGDGEGSESLSLLSYTLKYISLKDVDMLYQVGL